MGGRASISATWTGTSTADRAVGGVVFALGARRAGRMLLAAAYLIG
jgi:hypothetical protein